jgi:hypothetical protein
MRWLEPVVSMAGANDRFLVNPTIRWRGQEWLLWVDSGRLGGMDRAGLLTLSPLGPGHHHVDAAAAAPGAEEPLAPLDDRGVCAVPLDHLGGVKLDPMAARLAPTRSAARAPQPRCRTLR